MQTLAAMDELVDFAAMAAAYVFRSYRRGNYSDVGGVHPGS